MKTSLCGLLWCFFSCTCVFEVNFGNRSWEISAVQTGRVPSCQITLSYRVHRASRQQKWIPPPLRGEQQIGEMSPNNHRHLLRRRKADIYPWAKGRDPSSGRVSCVYASYMTVYPPSWTHLSLFNCVGFIFLSYRLNSYNLKKKRIWEESWRTKAFTGKH